MNIKKDADIYNEFLDVAHMCADQKLVFGSSGNLSCKPIGRNKILITSSGSWMSKLTQNEIVEIYTGSSRMSNCVGHPSSELDLHQKIYSKINECQAILHFQSEYATAVSCLKGGNSINFNIIPEVPAYIRNVFFVEQYMPGSTDLAVAVSDKSEIDSIIVMQNHGIVSVGRSLPIVLQMSIFLNLLAKFC
jgi:ribulose-5-phosphate 4-epimerase/fuculose-1-phosphate aldolase